MTILVNCVHRHCVFTIPEELRIYFLNDRSLLNCLFHSVRDVVLRMFHKQNKAELFTPGFILVLHTFGRDLKWNPRQIVQTTQNKKFHNQSHREVRTPSLFCYAIFYSLIIIS